MDYDDFELTNSVTKEEWDAMEPYERFIVLFIDNGGSKAKDGINEAVYMVEKFADDYGVSNEQKKLMLKNLELAYEIVDFPIMDVKWWIENKK